MQAIAGVHANSLMSVKNSTIVCIGVSTLPRPQKHHLLSCQAPLETVQTLYIGFSWPPYKSNFLVNVQFIRFYCIFYVKIAMPLPSLKNVTSLFPSNLPLKVEVLSSLLFLKIW